ncbi:MAG TPA: ABC transporter ATP-binding protein [Acidimicrobiia bacterium]|nr:ABC transporter ATP-binding protein [Acidimicrobiia bacterium]
MAQVTAAVRWGLELAVELQGITKRYPGVVANDEVDLAVVPGEVHAVVGENGAGKSTLMKILYGMVHADQGTIRVNGQPKRFRSSKDAIAAGIGMVHQHFKLADNLTVLENVVLGSEPTKGLQLDFAGGATRIRSLASTYGLAIDPDTTVEQLSVGERQRVEILKVLYRGARIIILDEPTAVLVPQEVDDLFASLEDLKGEGVTVIFISHKLDEVLKVADHITVMRGGRTVGTVTPAETDGRRLAEMMIGAELPSPQTAESTVTDVVVISVRDLNVISADERSVCTDVSFDIHKGEIVGVAGVEGNGQGPLVDALLGISPHRVDGRIELVGERIDHWPARRRREAGVGLIPEDRQRQGLLLPSPLWENAALGHQTSEPFVSGLWINVKGSKARTRHLISDFGVKTPGTDVPATALSGGNQQKLVVGREILADPKVLIAAQPTRGIDVGAQATVWEKLKEVRKAGMAILLISADLEELIGLSDTLYVIFRGRFVARLDPATVTPEILGSHMTGASLGEAV